MAGCYFDCDLAQCPAVDIPTLRAEIDKAGFDDGYYNDMSKFPKKELREFSKHYPTMIFELRCHHQGASWVIYYKNGQKQVVDAHSLKIE